MLQPIANHAGLIFGGMLVMWLIQFALAWWQMRRFYARITVLRRDGMTAIGMSGDRWRGRSYAVLTVNEENRVIHAEMFAGWTVFAGLQPIPQLLGLSLDDLIDPVQAGTLPRKWQNAVDQAASIIKNARLKMKLPTDEETPAEVMTG